MFASSRLTGTAVDILDILYIRCNFGLSRRIRNLSQLTHLEELILPKFPLRVLFEL